MAPEQLRSSSSVDGRADVWSLGVTLFELVSGEAPFQGDSVIELCAAIATEPPRDLTALLRAAASEPSNSVSKEVARLSQVLTWCLEKSCERRCPDIATLAESLESLAGDEGKASARRVGRIHQRMASAPPVAGSTPPNGPSSTPSGSPFSQPRPAVDPATASTLSVTFGAISQPTTARGVRRWALPIGGVALISMVIAALAIRQNTTTVSTSTVRDAEPTALSSAAVPVIEYQIPHAERDASSAISNSSALAPALASAPKVLAPSLSAPAPNAIAHGVSAVKDHRTDRAAPPQSTSANPFQRDGLNDRH